jgi:hypothetical protein
MVFVNLIDSIPDLLYKHNCVIIPDFGGFITNFKHSGFDESRNIISPSCKKVAFNQSLIENDGLLVSNWAQKKEISYKQALDEIKSFADFLKERIFLNKSFDFKNIGTFYLSAEDKIIFVPYQGLNFLESSFGLYPIKIKSLNVQPALSISQNNAINNENLIEEDSTLLDENLTIGKTIRFYNPLFLKVASIIAIAAISIFSIFYLNSSPTAIGNEEQKASIINIDTYTFKKPQKTQKISLVNLEYNKERVKINQIKSRLDSFSVYNAPKNETYNVLIGYYKTEALATKLLKQILNDYTNAFLTEKTAEGYGVVVETFYKHTTANAFSVMLKQNGYKNIKIEKQIVIGE